MKYKRPPLDDYEMPARQLALAAGLDPDALVDMPDAPQGFQQPTWVIIMQRMRESPEEFAKHGIIRLLPKLKGKNDEPT